jgi:hypothetical protein
MAWSERFLEWVRGLVPRPKAPLAPDAPSPAHHRLSGDYGALYTYLENRYAISVVLTFEQIESLLGFALPPMAHSDAAWWTTPSHPPDARHQNAWKLADRTAAPNLLARTVAFERGS